MATSINEGNQKITLRFKQPATTADFNTYLRHIIKPGIYKGILLSIPSGNNIVISSGKMWFNAPFTVDNIGVSAELRTAITGRVLTIGKPIVYFRYEWFNINQNFAELILGDETDLSNDISGGFTPIIVGEGVFDGPTLTGFNYDRRSWGSYDVDSDYALTATTDPSKSIHVGNRQYNDERYRQIKIEYEEVRNKSGVTIPAFRAVKIVDDFAAEEIPAIDIIEDDELDFPIGVTLSEVANGETVFIVRRGRVVVNGLDGALGIKGAPVYVDENGVVTLNETARAVGFLLDTTNPASVYFDIGSGGGLGGGAAQTVIQQVQQASHGFVVGEPVYIDVSGVWFRSIANSNETIGRGVVSRIINDNNFEVALQGRVVLTEAEWDFVTGEIGGLTIGRVYYVSESLAGRLSDFAEDIINPMLVGISPTIAMVQPGFQAAESGTGNTIIRNMYIADGIQTAFDLSAAPPSTLYCQVYLGGALQQSDTYSLNGVTLTFNTAPLIGTDIKVISTIATIFNTSIDQYVQRATTTLADQGEVILNSMNVFGTVVNGIYNVYVQDDPRIKAEILIKNGSPPEVDVNPNPLTTFIGLIDEPGKLCIFVVGNDLVVKNTLGVTHDIVFHRQI